MERTIANATDLPITIDNVYEAEARIRDEIYYTPVVTSTYLNNLSKYNLHFKCENLQKTGSFKIRGALNAVRNCDKADPIIVTHSSGNHAQAVAMAARLCGYEAQIVMPKGSLEVKKQGVIDFGAKITFCENVEQSRQQVADQIMSKLGPRGLFLSPVNHRDVMAGQGTMGLELLKQVPELDVIVASVGGGGMLSGICVAAKSIKPSIKVIAAEPIEADDCARSLAAGTLIPNKSPPQTICDALLTSVRDLPWSVISQLCDGVVTVTDNEVIAAMKMIFEKMKLVVEPSACCPLAAVLKSEFSDLVGNVDNVGLVLCGGNADLNNLPW